MLNFAETKKFNKAPRIEEGTYPARICRLIDLGVQKTEWKGEEKTAHKILLTFELPTEMIEVQDKEGNKVMKPRWISKDYTVSNHEKSALYAIIKAVDPTGEATKQGRHAKGLLGLPLMINVGSTETGNAKVIGASRLMKGMLVDDLVNEPVYFDLDKPDTALFDTFPDWLKEKIKTGVDFDQTPFAQVSSTTTSPF